LAQEQKDENLIFQAIEKMRSISKEAVAKSKSARRQKERTRIATESILSSEDTGVQSNLTEVTDNNNSVKIFEDIELW
jgi:hypothetical protein